jgi:hypothetical protein
MPNPLELRLHDLAAAFARRIAKMIGGLSIEELAALCDEGDAPVAKARRKTKAAVSTGSTGSTVSTSIRHSPPKLQRRRGDGGQPPEDRATAFRRAEQERLETAVLKFVALSPGTDAEIVSQRVGLPKGKAQDLLDDLVLKGRLRMKSGQHGRCYVVD